MANTFTARDTLKTKLLAALGSATTADQIVKLSRTIEKANLDDDADLETALDTKVSAMATTASTGDIEKLAFGVKKLRTSETATDPVSSMIPEGSSNLYVTDSRVRSSFSAAGDLSYNSGTGVLSYTALPDALTVYATVADLPLPENTPSGAKGIVEENKKLYINTGSDWLNVGLVDQKPSFTTTPDGTYTLSPGADTVITLAATDPQGDPITFSHVVSAGTLGGTTVSQSDNVFTITGSSDSNDTAPFSITFRASDGTNITDTTSEFTVQFVVPTKIVVGAYGATPNGAVSGAAYTYDLDGTNEFKIIPTDGASDDYFGIATAVGDGKIVIGAHAVDANGGDSGAVYVYDINGSNEVKITPSDGAASDQFGRAVAVGDGKVVVGAKYDDDDGNSSGSAYIYDYDGTNEVKITASDGTASDTFGWSVAVGNNKVAVGARMNNGGRGAVYVYNLDGSGETKITASDAWMSDYFGWSVAIGNNKIVVGAPFEDSKGDAAGQVYIYNLNGSGEVKITAPDGAAVDFFGESVAIGDNRIVVGSKSDDDNGADSGSVYVFYTSGGFSTKITASDGAANDKFGYSVGVADGKVVVGASSSRSVYVYDLDGSDEVKINASDTTTTDNFAFSVSIG